MPYIRAYIKTVVEHCEKAGNIERLTKSLTCKSVGWVRTPQGTWLKCFLGKVAILNHTFFETLPCMYRKACEILKSKVPFLLLKRDDKKWHHLSGWF